MKKEPSTLGLTDGWRADCGALMRRSRKPAGVFFSIALILDILGVGLAAPILPNLDKHSDTSRFDGSYGPAADAPVFTLFQGADLGQATAWRSRRQDPTGLCWLGARYYDPDAGRFLSPDPVGHGAGTSLFEYAAGDPVNFIDPDGRYQRQWENYFDDLDEFGPSIAQNSGESAISDLDGWNDLVSESSGDAGMFKNLTGANDVGEWSFRFANMMGIKLASLDRETVDAFEQATGRQVAHKEYLDALPDTATNRLAGTALLTGYLLEPVLNGGRATSMSGLVKLMEFAELQSIRTVVRTEFQIARTRPPGTGGGLPKGITLDATVHRAVNPRYVGAAFDFHAPSNLGASHRYTDIGRGGIYSGTSREAVLAELAHYGVDPSKAAWVTKNVRVENVLDLTDPVVRQQLGITLDQITGDSYFYTHALGDFARGQGYGGILFPSAWVPETSNFVEFIDHAP